MLVLIVDDNHFRQAELAMAFIQAGFQSASTSNRDFAECFIQKGLVDLLVIAERVGGRLTHSLSLLAEYQNPLVETILLTPRRDPDIDELFSLLPSLHCMVAPDTPPTLITKLAVSAVKGATRKDEWSLLMEDPDIIDPAESALLPPNPREKGQRTGELLRTG